MSTVVADHELLDQWKAGDEAAFTLLVQRHERRAYRTAFALVGEAAAADDIMQEAFAQTFRTAHRLHKDVAFSTWLYRSVVWEARRYAGRNRWRNVLRPLAAASKVGADQIEPVAMRLDLVRAIASLPRRQREVVVLRFYLDLTEAQTAETLSCPLGTVKSRMARALLALSQSPHVAEFSSSSGGSSNV